MTAEIPTRFASRTWVLTGGLVFALAHTQAPLFFSNQNQYFLHGLARAGTGDLASDWLANTIDPTPVFSTIVERTERWLPRTAFHAGYGVILFAYWVSAVALASTVVPLWTPAAFSLFTGLFVGIHSAAARWLSLQLTGVDYPWYLQAGLAGQYVLGPGLQPSTFGVGLLLALAAYARGRPFLAAALCGLTPVCHSTYLLPAALLIAGMIADQARHRQWRRGVLIGGIALLLVSPIVAFVLICFSPTDSASFAQSQRILADLRIPHHTRIDRWLEGVALLQIAWIVLGMIVLRRTRLAAVLPVAVAGSAALTLVQWLTGNPTLALLFSWRLSVILVPVSTAMACGLAAVALAGRLPPVASGVIGLSVIGATLLGWLAVADGRFGYATDPAEDDLLAFVRENRRPGDVYLLPVRLPFGPPGPRGSISTTFAPRRPANPTFPVDLQRFRLATGAAIYVDFKSIPYADVEVLEWHRRMSRGDDWYTRTIWDASVLDDFRKAGITHVVTINGKTPPCDGLELVFTGRAYSLLRVPPGR
jgi:hypothetical protein